MIQPTPPPETFWTCPHCRALNSDVRAWTAIPMCSQCQRDVHWDEIIDVTPPERRSTR